MSAPLQVSEDDIDRPAGAQALLEAAIDVLNTQGESALRLTDVAERAGVSFGLIAHHFGNRDGLIAAAQQARFAGSVGEDIARIEPLLRLTPTTDQLMRVVVEMTRMTISSDRRTVRLGRAAAIGTAHGHPAASEQLGAVTGDLIGRMTRMLETFQEQGLLRSDVDARALGTFIQAYALGMVLHDLDPDAASDDAIAHVITTALEAFIVHED